MHGCAEAGSSAPASAPGLQGQLPINCDTSNSSFARKDSGSPSLRVDTFRQARTSKKALEARDLLDKVAQSINPAVRPATVEELGDELADFPDIGELSFPNLKSQELPSMTPTLAKDGLKTCDLNVSAEGEEPASGAGGGAEACMDAPAGSDDVAPVRRQVTGGMKASGSFSDALQLLLQSRSAGVPAPKVKQAVPRPRSGLVHVSPAVAVAADRSSEDMSGPGTEPDDPSASTSVEEPPAGAVMDGPDAADSMSSASVRGLGNSTVPRDLHALPTSLLASYVPSFLMHPTLRWPMDSAVVPC